MRKSSALIMLGLLFSSAVWGQVPNLPKIPNKEGPEQLAADKPPSGIHELTASDVEAFLDGIVPLQLEREDIAGATIAVVKDGNILFARGYGYADVEKKKPVSAEETLFRVGSVSKLFTWTAVMQLVEQGKLDLDRDVNEYLDFKIPEAFGKPITLKNLLTHTPGFEEQIKDLFSTGSESPNLGEHLKTHIPARIYPPGTTPAYSNYGASLAGYIVERVSGRPFNEYIEEHIFKPLGMTHSTFVQPLPPALAPNMSNGYVLASDAPKLFEVVNTPPAGSMSSTATDMARFMLAHLQDGQLGEARILRPETAQLMHSRLFALDPAANAMAYGFYEETRNGHRIIGHAGDTIQFHSDLHLIPDTGVGFFVSYNSGGKGQISPRTILWEAFLDRYFPYTTPAAPTLDSAKEDAKAVSGTYKLSRRSDTSFLKAASLIGETTVSAAEDGTIKVAALTAPNGKPRRWREVAPLTFRDVNGQDTLIFKPDQHGQMQMAISFPFMIFQRVGLWENTRILLPVLGASLLIMLLTLILWFVAWLVRRHYGHKLELTPMERWLRIGVRLVFALDLFFIAALIGLIVYATTNIDFLSDRGNTWFHLVQVIGVLGAIGTLVVLYNAIRTWTNKRSGIWGKLQAAIFVLACLGFLWFAFAGNLLRFSSNY
ncbi:MAG: beta-lactamase family protein [Pyrinomonadaceae bacterium]|nr:beta-lactamase family protein [Pyrinomonadaceae bacterium]